MFLSKSAVRTVNILRAVGIFLLCIAALFFSEECSKGAENGIRLCLSTLVPSLFPFMVLASYITESGLAEKIGRHLSWMTKPIFGLDGCFASSILLSVTGGYPVGAKSISSLYKKGIANENECKRASLFLVCSGPGFLVNFIGTRIYSSAEIGFILFGAQCISVVVLGFILKFFYRNNTYNKQNNNSNNEILFDTPQKGDALVKSVLDGAKGMFAICAFVVLFSAFTEIFCSHITDENIQKPFLILTEVCGAVTSVSKDLPIEVAAFSAGFGGLCVHFQIFSALGDIKVNKLLFFAFRILQGIITALFTHLGIKIFSVTTDVFSTSAVENFSFFGGTVLSGAALLFTALCFIYSLKNYKQN